MHIHFLDNPTPYDGSQLRSHWIYDQTGLVGDAILVFTGKADVDLSHMVDKEDVRKKAPIYSEDMLHFIIEHFDQDLEKMVLRQRLLISLIRDELAEGAPDHVFVRRGDDVFHEHSKMTVSIATLSPVSALIHTGINISSLNTPVPTLGLTDVGLEAKPFGWGIAQRYAEEMKTVRHARCKVRGVS